MNDLINADFSELEQRASLYPLGTRLLDMHELKCIAARFGGYKVCKSVRYEAEVRSIIALMLAYGAPNHPQQLRSMAEYISGRQQHRAAHSK